MLYYTKTNNNGFKNAPTISTIKVVQYTQKLD